MSNAPPIKPPPVDGLYTAPWSPGKLVRMLALFGPAAVVASVAIGAGETIVVVRAGAFMGYGLLWMVLASVLVKGVFGTYLIGRYTAISGEPFGSRIARLPGPRGWLLMLLVLLEMAAAPPLWAAIARPSGELIGHLLNQQASARLIATAFLAAAVLLSLKTAYKFLERQQIVICGLLVIGTIVGTAMVRPDLGAALVGLLSFGQIPEVVEAAPDEFRRNSAALLAVTFGYVGGSVMVYLAYPEWISLHQWGMTGSPELKEIERRAAQGAPADYLPTEPDQVQAVRRSLAPLRWDVACGAAVLLIVTVSFMIAGAAVLHGRLASGEVQSAFAGWSLLTDQGDIWRSIHPMLVWVYYVCVLLALWGTLQAYPDIYARCITDYARAIWSGCQWTQPWVQKWVCLYVLLGATAVLWTDVNFDLMTMIVAFLATNLGVAIAMLASLYLNQQLPQAYRTSGWVFVGGVLSTVAMFVVSAIAGWGVWKAVAGALL